MTLEWEHLLADFKLSTTSSCVFQCVFCSKIQVGITRINTAQVDSKVRKSIYTKEFKLWEIWGTHINCRRQSESQSIVNTNGKQPLLIGVDAECNVQLRTRNISVMSDFHE